MDFEDLGYGSLDFTDDANLNCLNYNIPSVADCMNCGQCLSACPTYHLFDQEAETPRSRVRSIRKVLLNAEPLTTEERLHLNNCLQCLGCETVCPSKMHYGPMFDETRKTLAFNDGLLARIGYWLIEHKAWRSRLMPLVWLYRKSGVQQLLRKCGVLAGIGLLAADDLAGDPALSSMSQYYPSRTNTVNGIVALFTGCLAEHFDRSTLQSAIDLLTAIGFDVSIPPKQSCCGAIHQHNGQDAQRFIDNNRAVFNALTVDAVVYTASACGAMLSEYPFENNLENNFVRENLIDINEFLLKHWPDDLDLRPVDLAVAVHEPCSQRNILNNQHAVYALLDKIPGLNAVSLPDNHLCCGAGGNYMLTHPDNASGLRDKKKQLIGDAQVDFVVSSNFGCYLFMSKTVPNMIHPVSLLSMIVNKSHYHNS